MTKPYELHHVQKMTTSQPTRHDVTYMDTHLPGMIGKVVGYVTKAKGIDQPWRAYWLARGKQIDSLLIAEYYVAGHEGRAMAAQAVINFCLPSHAPVPLLSREEIMKQLHKLRSFKKVVGTRYHPKNGKDMYMLYKAGGTGTALFSAPLAIELIHRNRDDLKVSL